MDTKKIIYKFLFIAMKGQTEALSPASVSVCHLQSLVSELLPCFATVLQSAIIARMLRFIHPLPSRNVTLIYPANIRQTLECKNKIIMLVLYPIRVTFEPLHYGP